jgi:hypothetical protein
MTSPVACSPTILVAICQVWFATHFSRACSCDVVGADVRIDRGGHLECGKCSAPIRAARAA